MDEQRANIGRKKALGDVENALKKFDPSASNPAQVKGCWDGIDQAFTDAMNSLPPGDPVRAQLQAKREAIWDRYGMDSPNFVGRGPTKEEWQGYVGDVDTMLQDINGNAEINMIQLQSLMSQRQTAVQLTTSMMAKEDEGIRSVLKNI